MSGAVCIAKNTNDQFRWVEIDDPNADEDGDSPFGELFARTVLAFLEHSER